MTTVRSLAPAVVEADRTIEIVDIRPLAERCAETGHVPGSLAIPFDQDAEGNLASLLRQTDGRRIALACLTGRRSARAIEALELPAAYEIFNLEGGLLGWGAEGLPCVQLPVPLDDADLATVPNVGAFRRVLLSCFAAETIEASLRAESDPPDPIEMLRWCYWREDVDETCGDEFALARVVERAAVRSRGLGVQSEAIARNAGRMLTLLRVAARR